MKKVFKANLYFLIILLLEIFLPYGLRPIYKEFGVSDRRIVLVLNHAIMFLIPAIIYVIVTKSSARDTFKLNKLYLKDVLLIILLGFVCQPIMTFFALITSFFFENKIGAFMTGIGSTPYILLLMLVAVLPAITEEVTIRGVVLSGYDNTNKYKAALVTGLFFGMLHLDPQQFLYATVLGFILALVVRATKSIFATAIIHFLINGTSVTMQKLINIIFGKEYLMEQATEKSVQSLPINEKLIMVAVFGAIAIVFASFVYLIIRKLEERNIKRGIIVLEKHEDYSGDKVINWPFIGCIIVYIIFMTISIIVK
ncbi:CPBP family intramembrane glutamic endopeptidase [Clostridium gasigenes]|uniref:CPBP family intramembrane glutamic endopeptidase n=1 Tax=Clostridium gasigenes TaxID=94869 RepID=UPI001C0BEA5C|nr:CPBP family intramembrane glutamic endopeptidase [Clostridium gasigenes]MBU3109873.1 CPBP family intramembrane metalloprotease [Clostridium gasigenes]